MRSVVLIVAMWLDPAAVWFARSAIEGQCKEGPRGPRQWAKRGSRVLSHPWPPKAINRQSVLRGRGWPWRQSEVLQEVRNRAILTPPGPAPTHLDDIVNRLFVGHAAHVLAGFPDNCVDCVITSPPYWTSVSYDGAGNPPASYEAYLADLLTVWRECARVLRPNSKLCINAAIVPIKQSGNSASGAC